MRVPPGEPSALTKISTSYAFVAANVFRSADCYHPSVDEDADAIGQRKHGVHVVLDEQNSVPRLETLKEGNDAIGLLAREAGRRLVQ
jgi:hypothetical protein